MTDRASTRSRPSESPATRKRYVTRACDACKKRKSKCDGQEPCWRCQAADIQCTYDAVYRRVHRHKKPPPNPSTETPPATSTPPEDTVEDSTLDVFAETQDVTGREDTANTSVHAFLRRVSEHLSLAGQRLPRNLFSKPDPGQVLSTDSDAATQLILPPKETTLKYAACYFEHAHVTYRYIPRADFHESIDQLYNQHEPLLADNARVAGILHVLGVGCIWSASYEKQPVDDYRTKALRLLEGARARLDKATRLHQISIELLTAHVSKCQLECAANKYNDAWLTLGTAVRLGQMMGIHRAQRVPMDPVQKYKAEGLFWAMFMVDRYLSVAFGRPMMIQEEDITLPLPSEPPISVLPRLGADEGRVMAGVVAHAKITMIIGHTIKRLYTGPRVQGETQRQHVIAELEAELQDWLKTTPTFFHPRTTTTTNGNSNSNEPGQGEFYDVCWIFRRQQRTVRSAFHFANMLIYRGSLLHEFLHHVPSTPPPLAKPVSANVEKCIESARAVARMAAEIAHDEVYNSVYWTSSHFIFCAISILLVYHVLYQGPYDRDEFEALLENAIKGHQRLDSSQTFGDRGPFDQPSHAAANHEAPVSGSMGFRFPTHHTMGDSRLTSRLPSPMATAAHSHLLDPAAELYPGQVEQQASQWIPTTTGAAQWPSQQLVTAADGDTRMTQPQTSSRFNEATMNLWSVPNLNVPGGNILDMIMDVGFDDNGSHVDMDGSIM